MQDTAQLIYAGMTPDDRVPWGSMLAECLDCGRQWVAVYAYGTDTSRLECPECGAFNSEEAEDGEAVQVLPLH